MRFAIALLSLIYLTGQHGAYSGLFNAGPYELKVVRVERCEDEGTGEFIMDLHIKKKSTHKGFLQGVAISPYDFDENVHSEMNISRRGSRGWGINAYKMANNNFCQSLQNIIPTFFLAYFKAWGIEKPTCPIKAGNYTIDMDTDVRYLSKFSMLPYGIYKINYALNRGKPPVRFGCSEWYVTVTERPRS